ncbi:nucleotide-binding universal stress UspA family protein [Mucilaginibacter frigoritolerans]|uniref:Nucleotide-binding universal stress UspA family protein n=1 Tax=Mucilaginibacter frigoritolerans TaxID=652788 RepID=A0A562U4B7_9SPHI|nr:universal stress protein [Mucilaginibacter frigoritolerans]TWJ00663.1 nucleotide-binding universal stress UspA family protein [Mucilaginibacter frigoritolerans]
MKNILVPTDFSPAANCAARYALHLAAFLKADLTLCNAMLIPVNAIAAAQVAWPLETYDEIKKEVTEQLQQETEKLKHLLIERTDFFPNEFRPDISYTSEVGEVTDVIQDVMDKYYISLLVMGMSGKSGLERFFMGSPSHEVIEKGNFPVLLIPPSYTFQPVKKIAFATNFDRGDVNVLHTLACFAKTLDAEIEVCHISDNKFEETEGKYLADVFVMEICNKVNYPKIHYNHIKSRQVNQGLNWLHEHAGVDMLVMVHRPHSFLANMFLSSHTQKLAQHVSLPLLVFPPEYGAAI